MLKYLWELDLDNISLGWEEPYQKALNECPDGEIFSFDNLSYDDKFIENRYFYHPVGYRNAIYDLFNEYKVKAKELFESKDKYDFKTFTREIIKLDIVLYNLIISWTINYEYLEGNCYDPRNLPQEIHNMDFYFDFNCDKDEKYAKYKIISL